MAWILERCRPADYSRLEPPPFFSPVDGNAAAPIEHPEFEAMVARAKAELRGRGMAERRGVAVVVIRHLNKRGTGNPL